MNGYWECGVRQSAIIWVTYEIRWECFMRDWVEMQLLLLGTVIYCIQTGSRCSYCFPVLWSTVYRLGRDAAIASRYCDLLYTYIQDALIVFPGYSGIYYGFWAWSYVCVRHVYHILCHVRYCHSGKLYANITTSQLYDRTFCAPFISARCLDITMFDGTLCASFISADCLDITTNAA